MGGLVRHFSIPNYPAEELINRSNMSTKASREKFPMRLDSHKNLERIVAKSKVSQPKVAIRASSRLRQKQIIQNRSALFPGTAFVAHSNSLIGRIYLPDDVVINIFGIYLQSMENSHFGQHDWAGIRATPFFLASVAFAWGRIIRGTPSLWKHLDLHLDPRRYKIQCNLLQQWLDRTSGCEISVSVLTHLHDQLYWDAHLPRRIYDIVETRASQITNLAIPVFPDFATQKMSGFQNLKRLRVDCGQYYFPQTAEPALEIDASSLVRLQTYAVDYRLVKIVDTLGNVAPLDDLRSLSTQVVTAHLTYSALRMRHLQHLPRLNLLTHLDISSLENEPMPAHAIANDAPRLKFPNLTYLRCNSFVQISSQIAFAPCLSTLVCYIPLLGNPELEYLTEALDFLIGARCSRLEAFIVSSPDQLVNVYEDDLVALLWLHPELRDVSIIGAAYDEHEQGRYISDAFIRALSLIPPPTSNGGSDAEATRELLAPQLRTFTYCGPTEYHNFTAFNVWRTLRERFEVHATNHATVPCPLKVFRIISTNPISDYTDDSRGTSGLIAHLRVKYPDLRAHILENITKQEMFDAEKLSARIMPLDLKYLSYCDYPHGVRPGDPFDRDFFQLHFIMTLDERMARVYQQFEEL